MLKIGARKKTGRAQMGTDGVGWSEVCGWQPLCHTTGKTLLSPSTWGSWLAAPLLLQMMPKSKVASAR